MHSAALLKMGMVRKNLVRNGRPSDQLLRCLDLRSQISTVESDRPCSPG